VRSRDETTEHAAAAWPSTHPNRDAQSFLPASVTSYLCVLEYISGQLTVSASA